MIQPNTVSQGIATVFCPSDAGQDMGSALYPTYRRPESRYALTRACKR